MSLKRDMMRGTLDLLILSVVASEPTYGYEIMLSLNNLSDSVIAVKEGSLYPALHRLEKAGHIEGFWDTRGGGVPRRYYRITGPGRVHLETIRDEWLVYSESVRTIIAPEGSVHDSG